MESLLWTFIRIFRRKYEKTIPIFMDILTVYLRFSDTEYRKYKRKGFDKATYQHDCFEQREGPEVVLEAKQNGKVRTVQSDKYGKFQFSVDSGLLSIFAQKEGFLAGGEIILVREGRPIKNLQIVLKKRYSHILGIVTDGVKALSGVTVRLRNENLETIDQVFSDALGYYQFRNIGDNQKVAVSVYEEGFQEYISDFFLVDKNYEKEHIILRKKEKNML